jgi:CO/xanthine dehydrogenase Mo-binding subunit
VKVESDSIEPTDSLLSVTGPYAPEEGTAQQKSYLAKACGQTVFPSDFSLPDTLIGKVLRSPHPHCRINAIHVEEAKNIPGVRCVLTADDIPGINLFLKTTPDHPLLATEVCRTLADPIALVAADSEELADQALEAIHLDLTPLPGVFDPVEALSPSAPQLHPGGNLVREFQVVHGDIDQGMSEADIVVENEYKWPWIDHGYLETEAAVAAPGDDGTITLWRGTHDVYGDRLALSQIFMEDEEKFRVILLPPGGSFGGKHDQDGLFAALLAHYSHRPVRVQFDRRESLTTHNKRASMRIHHQLGATADGRITGMKVDIICDAGAYVHWSSFVLDFACIQATGPYRVPHAHVLGKLVYTNNVLAGGMRGLGTPQAEFAVESQMDQLSSELGIHPIKLRWLNALREGDEIITGELPPDCYFINTLEAAAEYMDLDLKESV